MNKLSAVARLRWLGLGGLVVTTATGPAIFMGVSDVSLEQRLPEGLMADVRPVAFGSASGADLVLSLLSDGSEPAPLLSMPSMRLIELASASLGYVADSGDRGIANRAYPDEGFASNGQFVGGNAGFGLDLPATANVATPEIGASSTAALAIATGSGGTPVAVHTAPRSLRAPSFSPDAALAVSVRSEIAILRVTSGVGRDGAMPAGRADQPSSSSPPPIGELGNRSSAESPADESRGESAGGTLFPGQTPDTMRTDTVLALESPDFVGGCVGTATWGRGRREHRACRIDRSGRHVGRFCCDRAVSCAPPSAGRAQSSHRRAGHASSSRLRFRPRRTRLLAPQTVTEFGVHDRRPSGRFSFRLRI